MAKSKKSTDQETASTAPEPDFDVVPDEEPIESDLVPEVKPGEAITLEENRPDPEVDPKADHAVLMERARHLIETVDLLLADLFVEEADPLRAQLDRFRAAVQSEDRHA